MYLTLILVPLKEPTTEKSNPKKLLDHRFLLKQISVNRIEIPISVNRIEIPISVNKMKIAIRVNRMKIPMSRFYLPFRTTLQNY